MSIIQEQDFLSHLHAIQSQNPPSLVLFPETKRIYDIPRTFGRRIQRPRCQNPL